MKKQTVTILLACTAFAMHASKDGSWYQRAAHKLKNAISGAKGNAQHSYKNSKQHELLSLLEDEVLTNEEIKDMLNQGTFLTSKQKQHLKKVNPNAFNVYKKIYDEVAAEATVEQLQALQF